MNFVEEATSFILVTWTVGWRQLNELIRPITSNVQLMQAEYRNRFNAN